MISTSERIEADLVELVDDDPYIRSAYAQVILGPTRFVESSVSVTIRRWLTHSAQNIKDVGISIK